MQTQLRLGHRRRQYRQQHVTIVGLAECVLQLREQLDAVVQRRIALFEPFDCIPQPFAGYSKLMQARHVALREPRRKRTRFTPTRANDSTRNVVARSRIAQVDTLRFHVNAAGTRFGAGGDGRISMHRPHARAVR